ncbi:DUF1365 domain-containing protein [uncultured Psychrosphaera sp.]|uniref:DUF1365 domain-containing protein n=1 Tax=uncultured Psychrosphaera sp. TaxID=1403522 RepID=UPI0026150B50|nr:DUF1365 domain-containing protein [uncultured Psychrosphaera sp.]
MKSSIYVGQVRHRRFTPKVNRFGYSLYMLALDVDEVSKPKFNLGVFGTRWLHPLRFNQKDYLKEQHVKKGFLKKAHIKSTDKTDLTPLKQRITEKVKQLDGNYQIEKVVMLVQVRCFGLYFSPANFYFCYDAQGVCNCMLAEVSNTPWNQRHYYLIDLNDRLENGDLLPTEKEFHVSPFMEIDMEYIWRIKQPSETSDALTIHIENHNLDSSVDKNADKNEQDSKVFDATLSLKKKPLNKTQLIKVLLGFPIMTLNIVLLIYWQAIKLFVKRVPFVSYQARKK